MRLETMPAAPGVSGVIAALHRTSGACSILEVVRVRLIVVVFLVTLWTVTPALACLPNQQMTSAEMACCKKMAGDCHMGPSAHPCCKTAPKANSSVAAVQPTADLYPGVVVEFSSDSFHPAPLGGGEVAQLYLGLPPPAPPGPNFLLRI